MMCKKLVMDRSARRVQQTAMISQKMNQSNTTTIAQEASRLSIETWCISQFTEGVHKGKTFGHVAEHVPNYAKTLKGMYCMTMQS